jgi:hypothetical protein
MINIKLGIAQAQFFRDNGYSDKNHLGGFLAAIKQHYVSRSQIHLAWADLFFVRKKQRMRNPYNISGIDIKITHR